MSVDASAVQRFEQKLDKIIKENQLSSQQLYNCDETGLNYKMLLSKTLADKDEKSAYKRSKEGVTVLLCANQSGAHKLKPLLMGKAKKPKAFKNVKMEILPVKYGNKKCLDGLFNF